MKIKDFLELTDFDFLKQQNSSLSEIRSWQNSLPELQKVLNGLDEYDIFLEYQLPNSPERIDVVISGEKVIFIELKQWSENNVEVIDKRRVKVLETEKLNPYLQVKGYQEHFFLHTDFNREIIPVVFLHNFEKNKINIYGDNIFYKNDYEKLNIFLKNNLKKPKEFRYKIQSTTKLAEVVRDVRKKFKLSTNQREVAYKVLDFYKSNKNILIKGIPGSGKSVVALNLHFYFLEKGISSVYITKNATPRIVFENFLETSGYRFALHSPNSFKTSEVAIVDEAHRLTKDQIQKIVKNSNLTILFYDEKQIISCKDIGNDIYQYIDEVLELNEEFRCSASNEYLNFIDLLLYESKKTNVLNYDFRVFDDIDQFVQTCVEFNAKITAGYCWEWKSKKEKNMFDIQIDNYKWQWNMFDENNWKKQFLWCIDQEQNDKIGCIHTTQGMEFDYVGVIIAEDLRYENDKIIADVSKRSKDDFTIQGNCNYDLIIKNTYRVLLTRGIKGCFVYCVDKDLKNFLKIKT